MSQILLDAVTDHSARLKLGRSAVLCRTPRGTLLRRDYYNREIWKPAIAVTGLPGDTTFHDLRHTFASTALAEGVPISEVSRWLGQVDHNNRGPVRPPGARGQRPRPGRAGQRVPLGARVPPKCPRRPMILLKRRSAAGAAGEPACRPGSVHPRERGPAAIHLGLPLPAASCGLPASIGRAALNRSRRPRAPEGARPL